MEPLRTDIQSIGYLRDVQVEVLQHRIEPVLTILFQQLLAEIALVRRKAVAGAEQTADVEAPVHIPGLHGVRYALDVQYGLVELDPVGVDVIGRWVVRVVGRAQIKRCTRLSTIIRLSFGK